jgi:hypothetical protein
MKELDKLDCMIIDGKGRSIVTSKINKFAKFILLRVSLETYGVFGLWCHPMHHEMVHYKFIPSILVESTYYSCIY